ncbi:hypothetical protein BCR43DRAFT_197247 [Syncephalastrum racemosum]|uniref:Transmembrane protein n=1 Tax=Syncephalastrum racemosum TaxID=13706 RepID=A0A1X2HHL3_SYNRA|nr:hypothetical protein BCR43DRAFT_197247 [Syncephalastrum racemosum]
MGGEKADQNSCHHKTCHAGFGKRLRSSFVFLFPQNFCFVAMHILSAAGISHISLPMPKKSAKTSTNLAYPHFHVFLFQRIHDIFTFLFFSLWLGVRSGEKATQKEKRGVV